MLGCKGAGVSMLTVRRSLKSFRHLPKFNEAATFGYPRVRVFLNSGSKTFGYPRQAPY
jgi:hypothetical protein